MQPSVSLINQLEEAVSSGSSSKRVNTLRQITNLFLNDGERLNEDQIRVFDDVLCHLVTHVESRVRAELSGRLAAVEFAPSGLIERLAFDDKIAVAGPVLENSSRLRESALVEIAKTKSQEHLLAMSGRQNLPEGVTDIIVDRGENMVIRKLATNKSARFSEAGYSGMVGRAEADDELTVILGLRIDLPAKFLRDLMQRATAAVRTRLAQLAPAELQDEIGGILKTISDRVRETTEPKRDFSQAEAVVARMKGLNELNDRAIIQFAQSHRFEEVAAALSILNNKAPIDMMARLLEGQSTDLILIPCKAAGLSWAALRAILANRHAKQRPDDVTLKLAQKDYDTLTTQTAERTLRFWQLHNNIEK